MSSGEDDPIVENDEEETPLEQMVSSGVTGLTLLVAFGLMFAGYGFFWVAFVVGFGALLPMALGAVKLYQRSEHGPDAGDGADRGDETADALETLRERYARGELTEVEFERRVEKLLGTESVEDARSYVASERRDRPVSDGDAVDGSDRGRAQDVERELE